MIYRTMLFGLRNGFGMHRKVIGLPEGVPEAPGEYWALLGHVEGNTPAHMGWCTPLRQPHLIHGKGGAPPPYHIPEKGGRKEGGASPFPSPLCHYLAGGAPKGGALGLPPHILGHPRAASSPLPPIYMREGCHTRAYDYSTQCTGTPRI